MESKSDVPHVELHPTCPVKHADALVGLDLNIFKETAMFTGCSLLQPGQSCAHACLATPEAKDAFVTRLKEAQSNHVQELGEIGPNVIP